MEFHMVSLLLVLQRYPGTVMSSCRILPRLSIPLGRKVSQPGPAKKNSLPQIVQFNPSLHDWKLRSRMHNVGLCSVSSRAIVHPGCFLLFFSVTALLPRCSVSPVWLLLPCVTSSVCTSAGSPACAEVEEEELYHCREAFKLVKSL